MKQRLAVDARPPSDRDRELAVEALAMRAAECGLTADDAETMLGVHAAWQASGRQHDLRLRTPALNYDGEPDGWGDYRPGELKAGQPRKLNPPSAVAGAPIWGREMWATEPHAYLLAVEGESDLWAARGLLRDDDDWAVVSAAGAAVVRGAVADIGARCEAMGWPLPSLVVALDGDRAGDDGAAKVAAEWQRLGGKAVVLRLPSKVKRDDRPDLPDDALGLDLRTMATGERRAELATKLTATAALAALPPVVEPYSDDERDDAAVLAERLPAAAEHAVKRARTGEATGGAAWWSKATNRDEAVAHGVAVVDADRYLLLGDQWQEWATGDDETLGRGVGWREIAAKRVTDQQRDEMRAFAGTGDATGKTAAFDEALKLASDACAPSGAAATRRALETKGDLAAGWRQIWRRSTGEAVEGVLCLDAVLRWRRPPDDDWATLDEWLVVEPVTPDLISDLPVLPFATTDLRARAKRVRRGDAAADLLAMLDDGDDLGLFGKWLRYQEMPDDETLNLAQMGGRVLWGEQGRAPVLMGVTSTGKGTYIDIVATLTGSRKAVNDLESWGDQWKVDELRGARLISMEEDPPDTGKPSKDEGKGVAVLLKQIRGETHDAKRKGVRGALTLRLPGVVMLAMNDDPTWLTTDGKVSALRKRIEVAEFTKPVPPVELASYGVRVAKSAPDAIAHWLLLAWLARCAGETTEPAAMAALADEIVTAGLRLSAKAMRALTDYDRNGTIASDEYAKAVLGWALEHDLDAQVTDDRTALRADGELGPTRLTRTLTKEGRAMRQGRSKGGGTTYGRRRLNEAGLGYLAAAKADAAPQATLAADAPVDGGLTDAATGEHYPLPDGD